jgi:hypothetical protein
MVNRVEVFSSLLSTGRFALLSLMIASTITLGGCDRDPCGKTGKVAEVIRRLTSDQRSALFKEANSCRERKCSLRTLLNLDFDWQRGVYLDRRSDKGSVVLAMCFDHGVDLKFSGLGTNARSIHLSYGDGENHQSELIWSNVSE